MSTLECKLEVDSLVIYGNYFIITPGF